MPDTYDPAALRALLLAAPPEPLTVALAHPEWTRINPQARDFYDAARAMTGPLLDRVALAEAALAALATWVARALPNGAQQMMEDVLADIAALDGGSPEMAAMDALGRALRAAREEVSRDA